MLPLWADSAWSRNIGRAASSICWERGSALWTWVETFVIRPPDTVAVTWSTPNRYWVTAPLAVPLVPVAFGVVVGGGGVVVGAGALEDGVVVGVVTVAPGAEPPAGGAP